MVGPIIYPATICLDRNLPIDIFADHPGHLPTVRGIVPFPKESLWKAKAHLQQSIAILTLFRFA